MRSSHLVIFFRWIGAAGMGSYAGAAAAGLIAVVTGRVFAPTSHWPQALPGLMLLGAALTAGAVVLTRQWLFPRITRRRALRGAAAGAVLTPLTVTISYLEDIAWVVLLLMAIGWLIACFTWLRWFRATRNGTVTPAPRRSTVDHGATAARR
ncbi:hypothetical protein [Actinokineospora iranica]|uniref:Uncharacterized protein n=1 Tax=Actinokineospora iranica TaxID=1271860 RepID=A0A1G6VTM2_9PSEU|nr:hypothetical protein [Actinokineospora iranica]SDD56185.1 hypothetical protein SAMN05216174_11356 [Actinokineospora iranica]